jgi:hypothetical protein
MSLLGAHDALVLPLRFHCIPENNSDGNQKWPKVKRRIAQMNSANQYLVIKQISSNDRFLSLDICTTICSTFAFFLDLLARTVD